MNILLTGATGFLGSHVLEMLLSCEGVKVTAVKRSFSNLDKIGHLAGHPALKLYDLDRTTLPEIFSAEKIDTSIHVATEYGRG